MVGTYTRWILWGLLALALVAGVALAASRPDLAHTIRLAVGLMMIPMGLFFIFSRRIFVEPPVTEAQHALRRRMAGAGAGYVVFGIGSLLPSGWVSAAFMFLAAAIIWASAFGFPARIFATRTPLQGGEV